MQDEKTCKECGAIYHRKPRTGFRQFARSQFCSKKCKGVAMRGDVERRFWSKIDVKGTDECWNWTAKSCAGFGYGAFANKRGNQKNVGAHRFSYELHFGLIPTGAHVLHRCDNPSCVNPRHLFLGDQVENMRDMNAKGRHARVGFKGSTNPNAKLSDGQVQEIRSLYPALTQQQIASRFGIQQAYVSTLVRGKMRVGIRET